MADTFDHKNDVIFTSKSLMAFINKIHTNIRDNYCFISTTEMANKRNNNINFNNNEQEIADVFSDWESTYIAKICVINKEFPLMAQSSLRYTWLQGGSLLKFEESLNGFTKQTRPIGTFYISENNDNQIHIVQIKGFKNSNFDNRDATGNNNNSISTNIINADIGNIDKIISKEGNFEKINVSGNVGKLKITNTEEAKRYLISEDSFRQIAPTAQYCNINIKITDTSKTFYKLDSKTPRSNTSSYYNYKISSIDLNQDYSLDTIFVTYKTGSSYNDTVSVNNGSANWGTITIEYPSYQIQNYTFKDQASAQLFYTAQNKESQCKYIENDQIKVYTTTTLYQWIGADPAAGIGGGNEQFILEGSIITDGGIAAAKSIKGYRVHGSVFNDYAEFRHTDTVASGRCVIETGNGDLIISTQRLQLGANIVSDTYGFSIGETTYANTPIAVCGRVLAYTFENRNLFKPGEAVCSGPDGTVSRMTREEIRNWPDAIVGYVSEIPQYDKWGSNQVDVNGRIWIKVK